MPAIMVMRRECIPLVGRKEAAGILGVAQQNLPRVKDLPEPLNRRQIPGFEVGAGPLWPRAEIEELASNKGKRERASGAV